MSDYNNFYNNMYGVNGYGNPYFYSTPQMQNYQMQVPQNQNALTDEEIARLMSQASSANVLNLNIAADDVLRGICCHKKDHRDVVQLKNDGSGNVWCPICKAEWSPEPSTKEEVKETIDKLISMMQNAKWTGEFPVNVVREYFSMIPLLEKFPDLYEYGSKNFDKFLNQRGFYNAADANIYNQYNSLFGPNMASYNNPYNTGGYYQQPLMGAPASPGYNPMQQPVPGPGYNPQYGDQANIMMQGSYYAQPQAAPQQPQAPQQPMMQQVPPVANPYAGMVPQYAPQAPVTPAAPYSPVYGTAQPAPAPAPTPAPATTTKETKVDL